MTVRSLTCHSAAFRLWEGHLDEGIGPLTDLEHDTIETPMVWSCEDPGEADDEGNRSDSA